MSFLDWTAESYAERCIDQTQQHIPDLVLAAGMATPIGAHKALGSTLAGLGGAIASTAMIGIGVFRIPSRETVKKAVTNHLLAITAERIYLFNAGPLLNVVGEGVSWKRSEVKTRLVEGPVTWRITLYLPRTDPLDLELLVRGSSHPNKQVVGLLMRNPA